MQSQRRTDIRAPLLLSSIYLNSDVLPAKGPGKIAAILLGLLLFLLGLLLLIILLELLHSLLGGLVILIQGDLKLHCVPVPVNGEGHLIARLTVLDGGFEGLAARTASTSEPAGTPYCWASWGTSFIRMPTLGLPVT